MARMEWTDPTATRVLVLVEPELFRSAVARVLAGVPGIAARAEDPEHFQGPFMTRLMHPSRGPDVILASPDLAPRLAFTGLPVVEVPEASEPAVTLYVGGTRSERRAATLRSLVQLVSELVREGREAAAEAR